MTAPAPQDATADLREALEDFQRRDGYQKQVIVDLLTDFGELLLARVKPPLLADLDALRRERDDARCVGEALSRAADANLEAAEAAEALTADLARAREGVERLSETYTDEAGNVWSPPTAWAYFAACRALDWKCGEIERLTKALLTIASGQSGAEFIAADALAHEEAVRRARAALANQGGEKRCTLTGNPCGTDTVLKGESCPDARNGFVCVALANQGGGDAA